MSRISFAAGLTVAILLLMVAQAEPPKEKTERVIIPLDQISACEMPGTRPIEEIAGLADMRQLGSVFESWFSRSDRLKFKNVARPGFAVPGRGVRALRNAIASFMEEKKPNIAFTPDEDVTIVFFSEPSDGNHVRIEDVERTCNQIEIQYRLEPYLERALSQTFVLIPLGKMPVDEYHVEMHQLPREQRFIEWGYKELDEDWSRKVLCRPFSFVVKEKRE